MSEYNNPPIKFELNQGVYVTQIINTSTPGKERVQLSKAIVVTIRAFMQQKEPTQETNDMVVFIILALKEIATGIEKSVAAWEKRDYWVKADKYRMEWHWTGETAEKLQQVFEQKDWQEIASIMLEIMGKFNDIKVSSRHRMGKPWIGTMKKFRAMR